MVPPNKAAPNIQRPHPVSAALDGRQDHGVGPTQIPLPPSILENEKKESNENDNDPAITSLYLKYAEETDSALMTQYNADMDILLLFVSAK